MDTSPKNRVKAWRDKALPGVELLRAEYHKHHFPPHAHEEFAIGFIERGAQGVLQERRERIVMPAGTICVINAGQLHEGREVTEAGWDYRMMYISPGDLKAMLSVPAEGVIHFPQSVIDDPQTLLAIRLAHACSESGDASLLEQSSRLTLALHQLVDRHALRDRRVAAMLAMSGAVKRAREYIDANIAANPTLAEIGEAAGMSPFHLLREFRKAVGVAPHAYLVQRRVEQARRLLLTGRPLRWIAMDIGYADQAHLSREFRRFYGVPPSAMLSGA